MMVPTPSSPGEKAILWYDELTNRNVDSLLRYHLLLNYAWGISGCTMDSLIELSSYLKQNE